MSISRRRFVQSAAISAAAFSFPGISAACRATPAIVAPSDRIRFGVIGCNGMGFSNLRSLLKVDGAECVALCDVDAGVLAKRASDAAGLQASTPATYADHRALLDQDDIDAVIIGTPDHWHPILTLDALDAGKHVYVEKPLANSIGEVDAMRAGAQNSDRLVQVGQWQRSGPHWRQAMEYVHSGALGKVRTVKVWAYQGWMKPVPVLADETTPDGVDYDRWLGPAAARAFNRNRFHFSFRWFWDYAGGLMTDWGVHLLDFALYGMQAGWPHTVVSSGGKFAYPDDASETPDTLQAIYEFDDFTLLWEHATGIDLGPYGRTHGVAFIGNRATLVVDRGGWEVIPEPRDDSFSPPTPEKVDGSDLDRHTLNFASAIREGSPLNAGIDVGHHVAAVAHMGNVAFRTRRKLTWNQTEHRFEDDDEANRLRAGISYREPWKLPSH